MSDSTQNRLAAAQERNTALARDFDPGKVKIKPGPGGRKLSYISHGLVTERLNEAAPDWTSTILQTFTSTDPNGKLHCSGVIIQLCINGTCRTEAGGPKQSEDFANEIKNACSDALKRAAMRFGVGLRMWETMVDAVGDDDYDPSSSVTSTVMQSSPHGKPPPREPNQERITQEQATWLLEDFIRHSITEGDRTLLLQHMFKKTKLGLLNHEEAQKLQTILVDDDLEELHERIAAAAHANRA